MTERNIDRLVKLAAKNITSGIINEPRVFYDVVTLEQPQLNGATVQLPGPVSVGDPDAFINRSQFPVRITHASAQLLWKEYNGVVIGLDERKIQGAGLNLRHHDEYYMSNDFQPLPLWATEYVALSPAVTMTTSTWEFPCPVILSARDSLLVETSVVLDLADYFPVEQVPSDLLASVSFTGTGVLSGRPYFFGAQLVLDTTPGVKRTFDPTKLRNTGAEPIALTNMTFSQPGFTVTEAAVPSFTTGNIRLLDIQVRQQGNGTQEEWFRGPTIPTLRPRMPAGLLGYHGGRSVVHRFPGDGLIWEPGDGVVPQLRALVANLEETDGETDVMPDIAISLMGYTSVV